MAGGAIVRFPSIQAVARELRELNANVEGECDVRLQVYENGQWCIRSGLSDYDQDHRGYWGASCIPGVVAGKIQLFRSTDVARELISQAKDQEQS